jgi:regulator of protease activity HflC (stomatin/prohibitin superfamily)
MNVASIVQVFAGLSWLLVVGAVVFLGAAIARRTGVGRVVPLVIGAVVLALVLNVTAAGIVFVEPQERGVVISALQPNGYRAQAIQPGLQWVVPFFENVKLYSISRQTYTMSGATNEGAIEGNDSIEARTKDGQQINIDASVIFAIDTAKVINLHIVWQDGYIDGVVRPVARSAIRDAASQFGVEEIVTTKRAEFISAITEAIGRRLAENNLIMVDFLLRDVKFSEQYAAAVEQKQVAEQQAQQAQLVVEQRKQEAEQARQVAQGQADAAVIAAEGAGQARLIQAEAEAKALELIAAALADNPDLIQYTYVQKLGDKVQVMLVPSNSPYLFNLPTLDTPSSTTVEISPEPEPSPEPTTTP